MAKKRLIEILAEQEGRGHAELRRMARVGSLRDIHGNIVSFEDLDYDNFVDEDDYTEPEFQRSIDNIERSLQAYQELVQKRKGLEELDSDQPAEWDQTSNFASRAETVLSRLRTIPVRTDEDWNERILDQAHELMMDLRTSRDDMEVVISWLEQEDRDQGE